MISPLEFAESKRLIVDNILNVQTKISMGQFMTPGPIAQFMAKLFNDCQGQDVYLLDPGAGLGVLTAAFVERLCKQKNAGTKISVRAFELDPLLAGYLLETLEYCRLYCQNFGIEFSAEVVEDDYILASSKKISPHSVDNTYKYTHAILNPPYKKIHSDSIHRLSLRNIGIETSNLYTAFLAITSQLLTPGGELVAITPRSFCNGPYFMPFRKLFLQEMQLRQFHVFHERDKAFEDADVLQENIIFHVIKEFPNSKSPVILSSSSNIDFNDCTKREIPLERIVLHESKELIINLPLDDLDDQVIDRVHAFNHNLADLDIEVSTGPVVDFRLKEFICEDFGVGTVPLIYPAHFKGYLVRWPENGRRKPNSIYDVPETKRWLMPLGYYTITRRFTSKEERKRIVAAVLDPSYFDSQNLGFENHLNIFHHNGKGINPTIAKGLTLYLNSTLVDLYFRQFNGHTQVNASDLRMLIYPSKEFLIKLGESIDLSTLPTQKEIDSLLEKMLQRYQQIDGPDPILAVNKIIEAKEILRDLNFPRSIQTNLAALCILAILGIKPSQPWREAALGFVDTPNILQFVKKYYGKSYTPETGKYIEKTILPEIYKYGSITIYKTTAIF
jgi:adenine-specific DNA-methyltransferase